MVRERGAAAQARSKRRRILAKFLAHVGSECVRCAMLLLGAVLDMTCAQKHSFETCALLFPTFFAACLFQSEKKCLETDSTLASGP